MYSHKMVIQELKNGKWIDKDEVFINGSLNSIMNGAVKVAYKMKLWKEKGGNIRCIKRRM